MSTHSTQQTKVSGKEISRPVLPLEKSPVVIVHRNLRASVDEVWAAWSNTDLLKQWWGPEGFTAPTVKMDFRIGGKYLLAMKDSEGKITRDAGVMKELIPNKKIVWSNHFSDKSGNAISAREAGMTGHWPKELYLTVEFTSVNPEQTNIRLRHEGIPTEMHDDCVKGWSSSLNKLQRLVEQI